VHEDAHLAQAAPHARRRKPARIETILFWRRTTVGTVRAHGRDKQANLSTRARAAASGATVGLLAAVGLSALSALLYAVWMIAILIMAVTGWR
jgi:hypothetical protein